jgi:hypothetical protein
VKDVIVQHAKWTQMASGTLYLLSGRAGRAGLGVTRLDAHRMYHDSHPAEMQEPRAYRFTAATSKEGSGFLSLAQTRPADVLVSSLS